MPFHKKNKKKLIIFVRKRRDSTDSNISSNVYTFKWLLYVSWNQLWSNVRFNRFPSKQWQLEYFFCLVTRAVVRWGLCWKSSCFTAGACGSAKELQLKIKPTYQIQNLLLQEIFTGIILPHLVRKSCAVKNV